VRQDVDMQLFSLLYECLNFHHRILIYQVWARGLGQGLARVTGFLIFFPEHPVLIFNCQFYPVQKMGFSIL